MYSFILSLRISSYIEKLKYDVIEGWVGGYVTGGAPVHLGALGQNALRSPFENGNLNKHSGRRVSDFFLLS